MYNSDHTATKWHRTKKYFFSSLLNQLMSSLDSFIQLCDAIALNVVFINAIARNVVFMNAIARNVVLLNPILLNFIIFNDILVNVILRNIIMLTVILMNVVPMKGILLSIILLSHSVKCSDKGHSVECRSDVCHSDECHFVESIILLNVVQVKAILTNVMASCTFVSSSWSKTSTPVSCHFWRQLSATRRRPGKACTLRSSPCRCQCYKFFILLGDQ